MHTTGTLTTGTARGGYPSRVNHPVLGNVRAEYTPVYGVGNDEVYATLELMRRYALEDSSTETIKLDAARVLRLVEVNGGPVAHSVWRYVRGQVKFVRDEDTAVAGGMALDGDNPVIEILVRPVDMSGGGVRARVGDCDDFSMWVASILVALKIPCSYVVMAGDSRDASRFSHVYVAAYENGERVAVDASHGGTAGWESPNFLGLKEEHEVLGGVMSGVWVLALGAALGWLTLKQMWKGGKNQ